MFAEEITICCFGSDFTDEQVFFIVIITRFVYNRNKLRMSYRVFQMNYDFYGWFIQDNQD
jgi:hypothetical protein